MDHRDIARVPVIQRVEPFHCSLPDTCHETFDQAAVYSAVTQYLEAVKRAKTDDGPKVVAQLEGHKFSDFFAHNGQIRKEDHRTILDVYQVQVKPKSEAKEDGDYYKEINKTGAADAFTPLSESKCKMGQ